VVTNLLVNAAQSIPEGNPGGNLVEVGTFSERDRVVVTVRDTGAGIEPELQRRIFQPFFTTKGREQGTGLGLSISADIVHHHRGEIRVTSAPGAGSTFEVWLPIAAVDRPGLAAGAAAQTPAAAPAAAAGPSPGATPAARARVLVIDDEEQLLMAYRRMLVNRFDVTVARGGREGLDVLARDTAWDAILCDVLMPGVDGPAIWEWLQQNQPALLSRVLFCSGGAFTPRSEAFAEVMTDRILDKPLSRSRLEEAIAARLAANAP